jgi:cytosine/creatinine deaminase
MYDKVVKNVRFLDREGLYEIGILDGKFASFATHELEGKEVWDACGDFILPPFVEMHTHLDTALIIGGPIENRTGTLFEGIQIWSERKTELTIDDVSDRAMKVLMMLMRHGVLHVRAAVDISDPDLVALRALLEVKKKVSHLIRLQIIAFPQDGIISCRQNQTRLIQAIEMGVDAISAVPHLEHTREAGIQSLEFCFSIARQYSVLIHIFCDEADDANSQFLEVVADLAIQQKYGDKVMVSHANAMAYYSEVYASKVISLVKSAGLTIVSCPLVNSVMQGRMDPYPKGRGITRVKELYEAGVNVCIAHDDIQSPFYPFGNGNILQAAYMAAHLAHMTGSEELTEILNMITYNGAKAFGLSRDEYGLEIGKRANFVTLPATNLPDLLCNHPTCRYVFKDGELLVSTLPNVTRWQRGLTRVGSAEEK